MELVMNGMTELNEEDMMLVDGGWSWSDVGGGFGILLGTAAVVSGPVGWTAMTGLAITGGAIGGGWMGYGMTH